MKHSTVLMKICSIVICLSPTIAASNTQDYIVTLKRSASDVQPLFLSSLKAADGIVVTHEWNYALNGFAVIRSPARLDSIGLNTLLNDPKVESIVQDGTVHAFASVTQTNAPWNLARLSAVRPLTGTVYNYTYDSSGGNGVDIYILGAWYLTFD
ncbi:hypothetical protein MD484_g3675, partial [Candolleomyces efflorescens]